MYAYLGLAFGLPLWIVWILFLIGFIDGSRADWIGDYTNNHAGEGFLPESPANALHWSIIDRLLHQYNPDWFLHAPWYVTVFASLFTAGGIIGTVLLILRTI